MLGLRHQALSSQEVLVAHVWPNLGTKADFHLFDLEALALSERIALSTH